MKRTSLDKLMEMYTKYDFHDAVLSSVFFDYENRILQFKIGHFRGPDDINSDLDLMIESTLKFVDAREISLLDFTDSKSVEIFFRAPGISLFREVLSDNNGHYEMIGTEGWKLTFAASDIEYSEIEIGWF